MVYNKYKLVMVLFENEYFQLHVFYPIKGYDIQINNIMTYIKYT